MNPIKNKLNDNVSGKHVIKTVPKCFACFISVADPDQDAAWTGLFGQRDPG